MSAVFELMATLGIDTSAFEDGLRGAQKFGQSAFGKGLAGAANIGVQAIKAAADATVSFAQSSIAAGQTFDASMSNVAAISGAAGSEFDALREKAMEMGARTKFSATQAADAFSYMAMAGWKTEDMLGGIEGVMNLAAASGEDLATTSDIVTDALTAFGLSASDSSHFANVLAAASSNANTNVSMMGETFKYAAPLAGSFGFSVEDTALAIGLMANAGIKSSQAGTSLRTIMTTLAGPIQLAGEAFGEATVEVTNADGSMRGLGEVMQELRGYWMQMSEAEKVSSAEALVGKNAMSGFLAIMNAGEADIEKLTGAIEHCDDAMENASGAADEMAQRMGDNLAGDITIFNSALEGAQIIISDGLTPTLRDFVQLGTKGLSDMTTAFREGGLDAALTSFGETLEQGIGMILEKLPQIIEVARTILEALADAISANLPMIIDSAVEVVSFLLLGIVDALPILADGAVELILALVNGISEALPELIPAAVEAVLMIVNALLENIPLLVDAAAKLILGLVEGISNAFPVIAEQGGVMVENLVGGIIGGLTILAPAALQIVYAIIEGIESGLLSIFNLGVQIVNRVVQAFTEDADKFFTVGVNWVEGLSEGIAQQVQRMIDRLKEWLNMVTSVIYETWGIHSPSTVMMEIGQNLILGLIEGITTTAETAVQMLVDSIVTIGQSILTGFTTLLGFVKEGIEASFDVIGLFIPDFVKKIVDAFAAKADSFLTIGSEYLKSFADGLKNSIANVLTIAKDLGLQVINAVKEALSINSPSAKMQEIGINTGEGFLIGLQSKIAGIVQAVRSMCSQMIQVVKSKVGEFKSAGVNMMAGIGKGFESSFANVKKKLKNMVSSLVNVVKSLLKIKSPSKVMEEIGEYTGEGFGEGLQNSMTDVGKYASKAVSNDVVKPFTASFKTFRMGTPEKTKDPDDDDDSYDYKDTYSYDDSDDYKDTSDYSDKKTTVNDTLNSITGDYFLDRFEQVVGDLSPDKYTNIDKVLGDDILRDSIMIDRLVGDKMNDLTKNIQVSQSKPQSIGDIIIPVYIGNESIETIVVNAMNRAAYRKGNMAYA